MEVYHYTKFDCLDKIVTKNGLSFRGSFYEEFSDSDYKWTKRVVSRIIKRICINRYACYDEDSSFSPIIISFGKNTHSKYMWEKYAEQYTGIQLILDSNKIQQYAKTKLDYFSHCVYMRKKGKMKRFLEHFSYNIECVNVPQLNIEAVSTLIKPIRFRKEQEVRYILSYSKLCSAHFTNGKVIFKEAIPLSSDKERFVCFPKETLLGIKVGYKSLEQLNEVRRLLIKCGYDLSLVNIEIYNPL